MVELGDSCHGARFRLTSGECWPKAFSEELSRLATLSDQYRQIRSRVLGNSQARFCMGGGDGDISLDPYSNSLTLGASQLRNE
ncbi:hypothetical protein AmaxDRAFT_3771 [Limnospira maxima CS-328]|uniref:Uncharacterized protein n=2 Tax=Limnospira TaxID=2596745 RepID=A0A9P1NXZ2_9CYAN|nr:hypothetical protein AmaxDRAFT_3771 [Limnospira maxima CS-328]UWU49697.1 hypothetical protein APLC1_4567 [Arthrospira platensis C1]CDM94212.1 conserved protein of unknown function [Limnospira indica PCC 8005]